MVPTIHPPFTLLGIGDISNGPAPLDIWIRKPQNVPKVMMDQNWSGNLSCCKKTASSILGTNILIFLTVKHRFAKGAKRDRSLLEPEPPSPIFIRGKSATHQKLISFQSELYEWIGINKSVVSINHKQVSWPYSKKPKALCHLRSALQFIWAGAHFLGFLVCCTFLFVTYCEPNKHLNHL